MYFVNFFVDNVDNFVENSNFSRLPSCFTHKFFFRKLHANAHIAT